MAIRLQFEREVCCDGVLLVSASFSRLAFAHFMGKFPLCLVFASFFRPRIQAFSSPSPRVRLALAAISRSRRMGKQSEASKIGDAENKAPPRRGVTMTHPAHFRQRVRQILDRECHDFSMDASLRRHLERVSHSTYNEISTFPAGVGARVEPLGPFESTSASKLFSALQIFVL